MVDHLGWHPQGDGRWYLGLPVPSGRIQDAGPVTLRTSLREIVGSFEPALILMPTQDLILADILDGDREAIEAVLRGHGVKLASDLLPVHRWSMACPSTAWAIANRTRFILAQADLLADDQAPATLLFLTSAGASEISPVVELLLGESAVVVHESVGEVIPSIAGT